jgi:hypothetical protein
MDGSMQKFILVVKGVETGKTLERWMFHCESTGSKENNQNDRFIRLILEFIIILIIFHYKVILYLINHNMKLHKKSKLLFVK